MPFDPASSPSQPRKIPVDAGPPILGHALAMMREPHRVMLAAYRRHGPVFRLRALGREILILAGPEANLLMARLGSDTLSTAEVYRDFATEQGNPNMVLACDGEEHGWRRRLLKQAAFTNNALDHHCLQISEVTRRMADALPNDRPVPAVHLMQRLILEQTGLCMANYSPLAHLKDFSHFLDTPINVFLSGRLPRIALRMPGYVAAKRRIRALIRDIVEFHRNRTPGPAGPDLVDVALAFRDARGQPLSEPDLFSVVLTPFIAGLDTVAHTCAFALFALLREPEARLRVLDEVDRVFSRGLPTRADLRDMPALHGAAMEGLRLYPVSTGVKRWLARDIEFAGHKLAAGQEVLIGTAVTQRMSEFFPDPDRYDLDRYTRARGEHRRPGAFAPFALGPHVCLGAGLAEMQIMLTLGTLLYTRHIELDPPDMRLRTTVDPTFRAREFNLRTRPR